MRHLRIYFAFVFLFSACATHQKNPPVMNNEKEFGVPANLADQFAVRDSGGGAPAAAPATEPKAEPASPSAIPVTKAEKVKQEKASAKVLKKEGNKIGKREVPNRWTMTPFFRDRKSTRLNSSH